MKPTLASRWFPPGTTLAVAAETLRGFGLEGLCLDVPGPVQAGRREDLRAWGVEVPLALLREGPGASAEDEARFLEGLGGVTSVASRLKASRIVVEGGGMGADVARELERSDEALRGELGRGEVPSAGEVPGQRERAREGAADRAARALHAPLRGGVPLAVRNGGRASDLLGFEETAWLLDDLPALGLAFDPAHALRLARLGLGPLPEVWSEQFARRIVALCVHGLGSDLAGGSHPEDGAPDWGTLAEALPRGIPWVLDLDPSLASTEVEDAIRYMTLLE